MKLYHLYIIFPAAYLIFLILVYTRIILNPVKAGLVQEWDSYPYAYVKEEFELG
ncbi:hypothetical protein KUV50_17935 [Membranicola marinus]|uniref:Uncharacterized protein n=1 Tax=Membranihabitans marinus TaxID=1227546 RepID=A0A953HQR1_9BACT|nr:hypothetical protein [Membranihabitans marinus]MBY5960037.1 hypothetical protein [Membranihabitans marinus]